MDSDPLDRKMLRDRIAVLTSLLRSIEQNARDVTGPSLDEPPVGVASENARPLGIAIADIGGSVESVVAIAPSGVGLR